MAEADQVTTMPSGDDAEALRTEGQKNERTRFEELNKFFKDKPEFVNEMFAVGHDLEKAKVEFSLRETARLQKENEELKATIEELQATNERLAASVGSKDGGAAVTFSIGREGADSEDFNSIAKARAKELGVPLHEAMSELSEERPELWAKHQRLGRTG